jgi:hypothetical protein
MIALETEPAITLLQRLAGQPFPIYLTDTLEPRATLEAGPTPHRVLICSVPKAGTYLLGGLLARLGMGDSHLHIAAAGCSDYRFAQRDRALKRPAEFHVALGIDVTLPLIGPGQFVVGHLPCEPDVLRAVAGFRVIVAIRDLRDTALSMMRFLLDTGRASFGPPDAGWRSLADPHEQFAAFLESEGVLYLRRFEGLADWLNVSGVHVVRFETVAGDEGLDAHVGHLDGGARGPEDLGRSRHRGPDRDDGRSDADVVGRSNAAPRVLEQRSGGYLRADWRQPRKSSLRVRLKQGPLTH